MTAIGERRAVISGLGKSAVGRRLGRTALDLTVDACLAAIVDAGLEPGTIDGLSTYPGGIGGPAGGSVQDALGLELDWHNGGAEGPAQLGAVVNACMAVATGLARHVLVFHTILAASSTGASQVGRVSGDLQWLLPFDAVSAANWHALEAQWHFDTYGTTREQLGWIPVTLRAHAGRNPEAIYRDGMTLDDYLAARMISSPLCLLDCDVPVDGSVALVVSTADYAPILLARPHTSTRLEPLAVSGRGGTSGMMLPVEPETRPGVCASRADVDPADVDVALLYDGFSIMTLTWLEELGFCPRGEGGRFVEGGKRIGLGGELPLNTDGGQLSAGRLHGFGLVHEAVRQLRGDCGDRQVDQAEVAVVSTGGGHISGCMLLTRGA